MHESLLRVTVSLLVEQTPIHETVLGPVGFLLWVRSIEYGIVYCVL